MTMTMMITMTTAMMINVIMAYLPLEKGRLPLSKVHFSLEGVAPPLSSWSFPWLRLTSPSVPDLSLVGRLPLIEGGVDPHALNVTINDEYITFY